MTRQESSVVGGNLNAVGTLLAILAAAAVCGGCRGQATPEQPPEEISAVRGVRTHLTIPKELSFEEQIAIPVSEWETSTGGTCAVTELDFAGEAGDSPRLPGECTIVLAPLSSLPELVDAGWVASMTLNDDALDARWDDVMEGLRNGMCRPGGEPGVLPVSCPVLACYYRSDLLEAAGKSPPETWDDYQTLLETLPDWAPEMAAVEPWGEEFRASLFLARAASLALHPDSLSLYLDIQTGEPLIASEAFLRSLADMQAASPYLDQASLTLGPGECLREVTEGRAALAIGLPASPTRDVPDSTDAGEGTAGGTIGVCPLPGSLSVFNRETGEWSDLSAESGPYRVTLAGFEGYAVCVHAGATEPQQRASWNLWGMIEDDLQTSGEPPAWLPGICRTSRLAGARRSPMSGLPASTWQAHLEVAANQLTSTRVAADLPLPQRQRFREPLGEQVTRALTEDASPEDALQAVGDEWIELIEELGRQRVLNTYRACLGLSPVSLP